MAAQREAAVNPMDVLSEISQYNTHRAQLDRQRAALLVIDMQEFFNDIGQAIVPSVASLIRRHVRAASR